MNFNKFRDDRIKAVGLKMYKIATKKKIAIK